MRVILTIFLIFSLAACAINPKPRPWTWIEKTELGLSWMAAGLNYYYAERALDDPRNYEANPIPGRHPTDLELGTYMLTSQVTATILAHYFPRWRPWLLGVKTTVNAGCAINDYNLTKR